MNSMVSRSGTCLKARTSASSSLACRRGWHAGKASKAMLNEAPLHSIPGPDPARRSIDAPVCGRVPRARIMVGAERKSNEIMVKRYFIDVFFGNTAIKYKYIM